MKRILLFFAAVAFLHAQQGQLVVGVHVLPQSTWLFNNDDSNEGPRLDYAHTLRFGAGITVGYGITDNMSVELDLLYSAQGQKYRGTRDVGGVTQELDAFTKINYLKLPLMLHFHTGVEKAGLSLFLGPQLALLLSYRDEWSIMDNNGNTISSITVTKTELQTTDPLTGNPVTRNLDAFIYNKTLFGAVFGIGASIPFSEAVTMDIILRFDMLFGDAENKNAKFTDTQEKYWKAGGKYYFDGPANKERAATKAVTGGLQVRFNYFIPL